MHSPVDLREPPKTANAEEGQEGLIGILKAGA